MSRTNWNRTVNEINRKKYVIPPGWDTREQVAESLQCAPDKVADLLKPGIQSGDIEKQEFPIWDDGRRMTVRVACYRVRGADAPAVVPTGDAADRVRAAIKRNPKHTDRQIAKNQRVPVSMVEAVRRGK